VSPRLDPFTSRVQLFPERVHIATDGSETDPLPTVCDQVTFSPFIEPTKPATVTVHVADILIVNGFGEQITEELLVAFCTDILLCPVLAT